ncbi:ATP-binding cassette domain-containing protein, partial [Streptococcus suis]
MAHIKIENLKYQYPVAEKLALDGITCEIRPGEFIGVLGRNGSGKSTFCQSLTGLVPN